ncbi:hypothetical protein [Accumulibacter sp.]|uniref:hypothetical protein n=1 Tax=Accumulibacter sp. TaxID=2053492 RepID=UPI0025DC0DB9|nr:hypothetical protein [Accumulibacter sp.]MCM8596730.1 hypothetical protein [Accumulibacter sp.]MCM8624736.1 hypothetical protein [Accumulibacter sp.]MDS4050879.1 hypothetical protein [Accumulibacter sp.]
MVGSVLRRWALPLSAACLALVAGPVAAVVEEIPLVDGTMWVKSSEDVKKAYLVGLANVVQVEAAYHAENPSLAGTGFSPRVVAGMKGQTLGGVLEALDRWYAAHPEELRRPVVETIWFEMVVPALPKRP